MPRSSPFDQQARALIPLALLNFFMADVQAGIGPFLGVFLIAHGWQSGSIGSVMTIGGFAGMLMMAPAGAFIDETTHKRACIIVLGICTVLASMTILLSQAFWVVALSQVATAVAGAAIGPALSGITLGIVRQAGFNRQTGYNQAFNHAGNLVGAALSGWLGWMFGLTAVFWLSAVFGVLTIGSVLMVPSAAIDDNEARGAVLTVIGPQGKTETAAQRKPSGFTVLAESKPLLILAGALALFHLGNGAMLPLYGLAVVSAKRGDPAAFVALTVVVAQGTMIITSLIAMHMAERRGQWLVLLISFMSLPVRGFVAAHLITAWGVYPVQILDGVGAGLQSVAVPALVARILNGTGRINAGQGIVMTVQGVGASLSPAIGGWLAQEIGYSAMFVILGSFALGSIALWIGFHGVLRAAAAVPEPIEVASPRLPEGTS
ncbi:MFS transporter [Rhizobium tropici]|uniref:MFS transporter n=1 Tax=Rhizobium tropici TaxID=398 RepID=A0A329Y180_RHITR|nr:MFS transporter [Rhizobium tropici]RAX37446.1 MFS transporter [Rhizobium tropici]